MADIDDCNVDGDDDSLYQPDNDEQHNDSNDCSYYPDEDNSDDDHSLQPDDNDDHDDGQCVLGGQKHKNEIIPVRQS